MAPQSVIKTNKHSLNSADGVPQLFNECCRAIQTNKHSLNNCGSPSTLARYKRRHDTVLEILALWILSAVKEECEVFVGLHVGLIGQSYYRPISNVFTSLRPDIVLKHQKSIISTLELTILCHDETNAISSKNFKLSKYNNLKHTLEPE